jgi:hypothetical protein
MYDNLVRAESLLPADPRPTELFALDYRIR